MKIITWEESREAMEALAFYKAKFITKRDLYSDSEKCNAHEKFKVILHFDENYNECGLMIEKEA